MDQNHQKVLQLLLANGAVKEAEFKAMCEDIFNARGFSQHDLDELRASIAKDIRTFSLDIKQSMFDDGHMYIGIVNTSNDDLTKLSHRFKPWEIILFRKAIEAIVDNEDGEIDRTELLNLRENNSVSEVRALVDRLALEKWLAPSILNDDLYTLGPRVFLELGTFIRDLGVLECSICHSDVLQVGWNYVDAS
ncbi:unnamed protein product [Aphanomyces euteiches]|nr:hypothetical protein Ae201684P_003741 [Aphanomyces euteiches]KAH9141303.1 hypothetical protein AeRB84_014504 [Aphanomyces euteiches]KAH9142337.1 hypothetical protein AeRB84_013606 [Aphanomyces euteiches]KAH9146498.1 hypothetical protein AeRB84_009603 [Aphanomyces euteiches]